MSETQQSAPPVARPEPSGQGVVVGQMAGCQDAAEAAHEQQLRAGAYRLLAALLRDAPDHAVLDTVAGFATLGETRDELVMAMSMLGLAARTCQPAGLAHEYHDLFIGLGRGELVPYGSWYLTGFLMEKPLGELRDDLAALGYARNDDVREPEDHVAALSEVMAMLIEDGAGIETQQRFFTAHIEPWFDRFFADLATAGSAVFYRAVARFGSAFTALEQQYLALRS